MKCEGEETPAWVNFFAVSRFLFPPDFLDDDLDDDLKCVKKIYREHERLSGKGFNAW